MANTEVGNTPRRNNLGLGSHEALIATFLSIGQYITSFYVFFYLKTPYLRDVADSVTIH